MDFSLLIADLTERRKQQEDLRSSTETGGEKLRSTVPT